MSRQCHARNKERQRCSQPADHEGDHYLMIEWMDGDSYDPDIDVPIPFIAPTRGGAVMAFNSAAEQASYEEEVLLDDLGTVPNGACFSCGCLEELHPCEAHQCRSFVP